MVMCYATSKDGLHWMKPNLGIVRYQRTAENNIVFAGTERTTYAGQATAFIDPHADARGRFILVYGSPPRPADQLRFIGRDVPIYACPFPK